MKKFNEILKEARKHQRKTLKEVGDYAGLSVTYVCDIEQGRNGKIPSIDALQKMEKFLSLSEGTLVKAAQKEKPLDVPPDAKAIFWRRPDLSLALLRASQDKSDEEITKLIRTMSKKGTPKKEGC